MVPLSFPQSPKGSERANLLEVIQRHQEGPKLAINCSRSLQVRLNDLTPTFTTLQGLVQEYLAAMSCKNEFGVRLKSPSLNVSSECAVMSVYGKQVHKVM